MADKKISALTASTTPLAGTEVLPIVQSGATVKVAVSDLTAGRAISATQLTLTTGNLIVASGQGIDFSATSHPAGMTSELLNDYEEGTWTPSQGGGLVVVGAFSSSGTYTKIGRIVTVCGDLNGATSIAANGGAIMFANLPFNMGVSSIGVAQNGNANSGSIIGGGAGSGTIYSASAVTASPSITFTLTYSV